MKKLSFYLCVTCILFTLSPVFGQQTNSGPVKTGIYDRADTRVDNMRYWMKMAEKGLTPYNPSIPLAPAVFKEIGRAHV